MKRDDRIREFPARHGASGRADPAPYAAPAVVQRVARQGEAAWPAFIEAYSDFILSCIGRVASSADERMEIYVHVCARLQSDDCRRLGQFRGRGDAGPCRFTTWLATVVLNLSKEWVRGLRGRRRMFKAITRMSHLDQLVFRYHHWEKFPADQIARALRCNHGMEVGAGDVEQSFRRIHEALPSTTHWRLVAAHQRARGEEQLDEEVCEGRVRADLLPHPAPPTDALARRREAEALLRDAVKALAPTERRALELRFAGGRTAKETASALGIENYKRVYEIQARALVKLRRRLSRSGVRLSDFGSEIDATELLK